MVILADIQTKEILGKYEAWAADAVETAQQDAEKLGRIVKDEITLMGDMIIWVEREAA
ncbi:MAG: hypothetical protein IKY89_05510 [Alistipes sp.]|nr:hypothetical protein [Alistipes sp.]